MLSCWCKAHLSKERQKQILALLSIVTFFWCSKSKHSRSTYGISWWCKAPQTSGLTYFTPKEAHFEKKSEYLLKHGLAKPSRRQWASPFILVPKSDGSIDCRRANTLTKPDSFPIFNRFSWQFKIHFKCWSVKGILSSYKANWVHLLC